VCLYEEGFSTACVDDCYSASVDERDTRRSRGYDACTHTVIHKEFCYIRQPGQCVIFTQRRTGERYPLMKDITQHLREIPRVPVCVHYCQRSVGGPATARWAVTCAHCRRERSTTSCFTRLPR